MHYAIFTWFDNNKCLGSSTVHLHACVSLSLCDSSTFSIRIYSLLKYYFRFLLILSSKAVSPVPWTIFRDRSTFYVQAYYSPCSTCDNELQYDTKVTCDLPLTNNVIYEAVYMVNLDICFQTFEFNDHVIYTLLRKYSTNLNQTNSHVSTSHLYLINFKKKRENKDIWCWKYTASIGPDTNMDRLCRINRNP